MTRCFIENDTLFFLCLEDIFWENTFSAHLQMAERCLATSIPHPSHAEIDAEKHKQGVANQVVCNSMKGCNLLRIISYLL